MQGEIERICQRLGLPSDPRKFTRHVTLARLRNTSPQEVASYLSARGNFSAAAMERFYGHLRRPLTLRSVEPIDPVTLQVRYDFATRAGATCDGRAIVRVRPTPSGTYIDTIRALSGC